VLYLEAAISIGLVPLFAADLCCVARALALLPRFDRWLDIGRAGPGHEQISRQRRGPGRYCQPHGRRNRPPVGGLHRFREDMAASENLMQRCSEIYRKLRNTFRFLLGNLNGFDTVTLPRSRGRLLPLDRYMLARTRELTEKVLDWYAAFEFHRIYTRSRVRHCGPEFVLSGCAQDRMYTFAPTSHERRSAQTVLWQFRKTLVRLVAPILSFTAR